MMKLILLFVVQGAIVVFGVPLRMIIDPNIVGGEDAAEGKYPYQVSIRYSGSHNCGGSILDETTILTAAHCIGSRTSRSHIVVGTNALHQGGVRYDIRASFIHPTYYTNLDGTYDIGLIKVDKNITFNEKIQPIKLATKDTEENVTVILTGWGYTSYPGKVSSRLQVIKLETITQETCENSWSQLVPTQLCTFTRIGEGACKGDSGGPLVDEAGEQVGIVSQGQPCALGFPDIYTRVYSFLDWIEETK